MKSASWFWAAIAGPQLIWRLALVYYGAFGLLLGLAVIGLLMMMPKSITVAMLDFVKALIW